MERVVSIASNNTRVDVLARVFWMVLLSEGAAILRVMAIIARVISNS